MRVADYIIEKINQQGVNHIFLVTGRGALFLTDAVARLKEMNSISMHHEQSAAFAAVAYSQYTGGLGACLVSTGCAMTNTITGVLNAWQDGIPCVFISGQNKLQETSRYTNIPVRTYGQQETDIISLVEPITKYAVMITDPTKIVYEVEKALYLANEGRKGPVWIDIPLDVQNMRVEPDELMHYDVQKGNFYEPSSKDIEYIKDALTKSNRPTLLIGSGIYAAKAEKELSTLVEQLGIPLTYSASSPDIYGTENKLSIGSVGMMGCSRAGNFTVQNSDLLIVIGCRLSSMTTGTEFEKFAREAKIIVVDIDAVEHSKKGVNIDRLVISDAKRLISSLLNTKLKETNIEWKNKCLHWKNIFPKCENDHLNLEKIDLYYLTEILGKTLPENASLVTDSGLIELVLPGNFNFKNTQKCIHPASQGSMGFALPAAIGAYYASQKPVVAVIGDGSVMMNLQELETISHNNIPIKIIIVNNNAYSVIRKRQKELFRSRTIGTDTSNGVSCPDFKKVANAFEIQYIRIDNSNALTDKLTSLFKAEGAVLCEIMGLENQEYITNWHTRNAENRFVNRPIEDQAPFLDRDLFLSEMIIKPIDQ